MKIIRSIKKLRAFISNVDNLGFVPTMGYIHKGHLSLVKKSIKKCNKTLVSIYVNPTQFNSKIDFINYPRNLNKDLKILKKNKVDFVFIPKTSEIYKKRNSNKLKVHRNKKILCGKYRKGHFEGVINILNRLLKIINPDFMFLGEKDFQQLFLIKNYVKKKFKVKIIGCKTIRNKNYVALSSRNNLLSKKDLIIASLISKKLMLFKKKVNRNYIYQKNINILKANLIKNYHVSLDYLELRNEKDLTIFKKKNKFRLFVAYYINKVRLIDNF